MHKRFNMPLRVSSVVLLLGLVAACSAQACSDNPCGSDEICMPVADGLSFKSSCIKIDSRFKTDSAHAGSSFPPQAGAGSGAGSLSAALLAVTALAAALRLV
ncbi:hypothetical protein FJT64_015704 [Amphibalanus amphitrite]|uniref:Uncharacterized protein n=1 Tax=Amphibalanus amphitrite TaxID=1232801 RepID=A0A6A4X6E5_AMPAM|nr:hypothetical protein FJT64_015704 [Amphibalanus amphitrite]